MKRKNLLVLLGNVCLALILVVVTVVGGCAKPAPPAEQPPAEKITWKLSFYGPATCAPGQVLQYFMDEMSKRTDGRFEIEPYWAAALCPPTEELEGLKSGLFDICLIFPPYDAAKLPLANLISLPCLVPTGDGVEEWSTYLSILNEYLQQPGITEELAKYNARPLSTLAPEYIQAISNVPITRVEDFQGVMIRSVGYTADLMKELGAAPVFATLPEVYDLLAKGTCEAYTHSWSSMYPFRLHEVTKYYIPGINLGHGADFLTINIKSYEALPKDMKEILHEVVNGIPNEVCGVNDSGMSEALEAFKEAGLVWLEFPEAEQEKVREIAKKIWKAEVDKLEEEGIPAREHFNILQDLIKKHLPGYEPSYL